MPESERTRGHRAAPRNVAEARRQRVLARVKKLLERMRRERDPGVPEQAREWVHPYTAEPCLSERDLKAWEGRNGVVLPEEYRVFLREVGNGGRMPGPYCDFELYPLGPGRADPALREPFPITRRRLRERWAQVQAEGWKAHPIPFPELDPYWEAGRPPGCLLVGEYPSSDGVLLIVTGELRGSIWCTVVGGMPEFKGRRQLFDFLSWFEDTLLEARQWGRPRPVVKSGKRGL